MALSRLTSLSILTVAVFAAACDDDISGPPPTGLAYAGATLECAGVAIYLATRPVQSVKPSAPYVRIVIRWPVERLTEQSWVVTGSGAQAAAWHHASGTDGEIATSGEVTVNAVASDNTIEGWADLTFAGVGRVGGNFRAFWIPGNPVCLARTTATEQVAS